jgi:hypothetical protein
VVVKKASRTKKAAKGGKLSERALGPAADAFGKELVPTGQKAGAVAARVGDLLLSGIDSAVYGLERASSWIHRAVTDRLKDVAPDKIVSPEPRIALPAMQALVYSMDDKVIREMFANLLAANMNAETQRQTHPAFSEIIKELIAFEAGVLKVVAEREQVEFQVRVQWSEGAFDLGYSYTFHVPGAGRDDGDVIRKAISNLRRLELIDIKWTEWPNIPELAEHERDCRAYFAKDMELLSRLSDAEKITRKVSGTPVLRIEKHGIFMTPLGKDFAQICLGPP